MSNKGFNRRQFLYGLGSAALYLPLFPSLLPRAHAQTAGKPPLRVVFIMSPNGQHEQNFWPKLEPGTQFQPNVFYSELTDVAGDLSAVLGSGYSPYKNKISILRGLDLVSENPDHNRTTFLACSASSDGKAGSPPKYGASADWILETSPGFYKTAPRVKALRLTTYANRGFSWSRTNSVAADLPYISNDKGLFNSAFAGFAGSSGPAVADSAPRRRLAAEKVMERMTSLKNSRRISSEDRQRFQDHMDLMNKLKDTFVPAPVTQECRVPTMNFYSSADQKRKLYENANDTIVAAFNCNITRMACIYIEDYDDKKDDYSHFHGISHTADPAAIAESAVSNKWIADRVLDLIMKLDSITETDGSTMLDNTIVVWGNEICAAPGAESHRGESLPLMIAGGKNANFKTGYYVDYRTRPFRRYANRGDFPPTGRPYNQLLASIMLSLGVQRSEFDIYGQHAGRFGEFRPGVYDKGEYSAYVTSYSDKLPFYYLG